MARRYGEWAGAPRGFPEDPRRCVEAVWVGWHERQCTRKRGHGPNGEYCKQHAKKIEELEARLAALRKDGE